MDISSSERSADAVDGDAALSEPKLKKLNISKDDTETLVSKLHNILKTLPVESPPGSEDIYGRDISIFWGSDDLQWTNGGPGRGGTGKSETVASDKDKEQFDKAVAIVCELVKRGDDRVEEN